MRPHVQYLRYVLRHKWFVFLAGLELGVPLWQLIVHDYTKFLPCEWFAYAAYFYGGPHRPLAEMTHYEKTHYWDIAWRRSKEGVQAAFDIAWNHHQKANPHHWQYWVLLMDDGGIVTLPMPDRFLREMVADWQGVGRALGKPDTRAWYEANKGKMQLAPLSRARVEGLLGVATT
jgi:hypothetical protein